VLAGFAEEDADEREFAAEEVLAAGDIEQETVHADVGSGGNVGGDEG